MARRGLQSHLRRIPALIQDCPLLIGDVKGERLAEIKQFRRSLKPFSRIKLGKLLVECYCYPVHPRLGAVSKQLWKQYRRRHSHQKYGKQSGIEKHPAKQALPSLHL